MMTPMKRHISKARLLTVLLAVGALAVTACSTVPKGLGEYDAGLKERGQASWYSEEFHGKPTASGEIYDQYGFSAAHRRLPLGSWVRVTNAATGVSVPVRINDRGPFIKGRIIDLSYAAAAKLGMIESGTTAVFLERLATGDLPIPLAAPEHNASKLPGTFHGGGKEEVWILRGGAERVSMLRHRLADLRDERRRFALEDAPHSVPLAWPSAD
jgi:rare lipoprotein A (peptidoglycan hydrolase)